MVILVFLRAVLPEFGLWGVRVIVIILHELANQPKCHLLPANQRITRKVLPVCSSDPESNGIRYEEAAYQSTNLQHEAAAVARKVFAFSRTIKTRELLRHVFG